MTGHPCSRRALAAFVFFLVLLLVSPVRAHLMPRGKGTLNVVGSKAYIVVSLPVVAFFRGAEHAPTLSQVELKHSEELLRSEIRKGLRVSSGDDVAVFDQVLLSLPSGEGHDGTTGEDVLVMIVARFSKTPTSIAVHSRLWKRDDGEPGPADELVIEATVSEGKKTVKSEVATFTSAERSHEFFAVKQTVMGLPLRDKFLPLLGGAALVLAILVSVVRSWLQRRSA